MYKAVVSTNMFEMSQIGERLRTQDNRITANPIFMVQELKRTWGIDTDYDPEITWLHDDEAVEVDPKKAKALERLYQYCGVEHEGYRRVGYVEEWVHVQPFFTEAAADLYIKQNGHNHKGRLLTYVESAYRNHEWNAVREYLKNSFQK